MIKEIKIENFKSIASLNLELGRLNVFIGANGSGKSNILEGIAVGSAGIEYKLDTEILFARGVRVEEDIFMPSAFKKENDDPMIISISENDTPNIVKIYRGGADIKLSPLVFEELRKNRVEDYISFEKSNLLNHLMPFLIYAPENTYLRDFVGVGQIKPLGIKGEGLFKLLVKIAKKQPELFQKINAHLELLDWFDGFEIPNDLMFTEKRIKIKDRYLKEGLQYFDQRSANEGFLYLLFYLTLFISDETPKFFAIDNIDNAMNPKMGDELVHLLAKLSKEHDKQVILTTHNPSILDGLDLSDEDQRLFVISRNKKGHTIALRVPHRESDERLSYRFIRGSIGGLPKNF
jgi:predicted ATPase